jgi:hypothetical protein
MKLATRLIIISLLMLSVATADNPTSDPAAPGGPGFGDDGPSLTAKPMYSDFLLTHLH